MPVRSHVYLVCSHCNNQFHDGSQFPSAETAREIRQYAKECGWIYARVLNGSMWDICPRCQAKQADQ